MKNVYIVMGVSGCGKSTIGKMLSERLKIPFYDADDFHPQTNIDKMASGTPLQDEDRWPWLDSLALEIQQWSGDKGSVLACSALKEVYRKRLFSESAFAKAKQNFIYLDANFEALSKRLASRKNHFFDPSLLQSQFDTLEVPQYGIHVEATLAKEYIIRRIQQIIEQ
ncbi:gluconokinase [Dokdonia sp. Hel_I_63]|uniref:gluconokinase n=1 Tax=Dokdonia sp. Hel_I_63 TaxID=1249996 RepID=UPI00119B96F6|nr:gluconokinase [Dokdonia sp. Hel_I_63]TVZ23280.1 gluconokinase [Dokdonia sp. Hel_I_63]